MKADRPKGKKQLKVSAVKAGQSVSKEETTEEFGDVHGFHTLDIYWLTTETMVILPIMIVCPNNFEPLKVDILFIKWQ